MAKIEALQLDDTIKQNSRGQAILGTLEGTCADFINPTRNGRMYDEALWEKVFNSDIINEYFEAGGIPGELDHPTDRLETCSEKIAIMMPEKPKKDKDGHLVARFDILDTPNGRIAYTLAKYGYRLGISSRGNGETYSGLDGQEHVDESTYDFQGFDLVLLPAVKAARLKMVESLQNGKTFKTAINEALEKANADEKKVMEETLNNLNIEYNKDKDNKEKENQIKQIKLKLDSLQDTLDWALEKGYSHRINSILNQLDELKKQLKDEYKHESVIDKSDIAANNVGAEMIKELQDSLLAKQKADTQVIELQEKLSVCYAKEAKYEEDIVKYKQAIRNLSESVSNGKALQTKLTLLEEELKNKDDLILNEQKKAQRIFEKHEASINRQNNLNECISSKNTEIQELKAEVKQLTENINNVKIKSNKEVESLKESLAESKKNLSIKTTEYNTKLTKANDLVEKYRATAKTAVNKYIESKALILGVNIKDITSKLGSNYSFADIDSICESLSDFKLKVSTLPFNIQKENKMVIKESKEPIMPKSRFDDTVDSSLLKLAGIKD